MDISTFFKAKEQVNTLQLKSDSLEKNLFGQYTPCLFEFNELPICESHDSVIQLESRRYIGCKQKLIDWIFDIIQAETVNIHTATDIFAGTGVVAKRGECDVKIFR